MRRWLWWCVPVLLLVGAAALWHKPLLWEWTKWRVQAHFEANSGTDGSLTPSGIYQNGYLGYLYRTGHVRSWGRSFVFEPGRDVSDIDAHLSKAADWPGVDCWLVVFRQERDVHGDVIGPWRVCGEMTEREWVWLQAELEHLVVFGDPISRDERQVRMFMGLEP